MVWLGWLVCVKWRFGRVPKDWQIDHAHKQKERQEWMNQLPLFLASQEECMPRCRETDGTKAGWYPVRFSSRPALQNTFPLSSKSSRNPGSVSKTYAHVLLTSGKHMARFLVKSSGACCGNMVWTGASCWASSNCIPAQKILSVSAELNHNRQRWCKTAKMVCVVTTPLHSQHQGSPTIVSGPNLTWSIWTG